jgi:hypothetical protein
VGTTSQYGQGLSLNTNATAYFRKAEDAPLTLRRDSTDGSILNFYKDQAAVGSIGAGGGDLIVGNGSVGIRFNDSISTLVPRTTSDLGSDGAINIGASSARFKDLHLSNQVYINGTTPNIRFTDSDTGADSQITASSGYGALVLKADYNNETAGSYLGFEVDGSEVGRFSNPTSLPSAFLVGTDSVGGDGISLRPRASGTSTTSQIRFNRADTTNSGIALLFMNNTQAVGQISHTNTATTYATSSDARLKDVTGEARGLEVITKLNPVAYNWKADGKADEGLIAQEVKELVPNAVTGSEDEHYQMDYSKLVTHLVKAVQELEQQTIELKEEIANLKGE